MSTKRSTSTPLKDAPASKMTAHNFYERALKDRFVRGSDFHNWQCYYAIHRQTFNITSKEILLTRNNNSICFFSMEEEELRNFMEYQVVSMCDLFVSDPQRQRVINPFQRRRRSNIGSSSSNNNNKSNHDDGDDDTAVFLRLSMSVIYFNKIAGSVRSQEVSKEEIPVGKVFQGGAVAVLKGIKVSSDGMIVSPMLVIEQVQQITPPSSSEKQVKRCMLDEDLPLSVSPSVEEEDREW